MITPRSEVSLAEVGGKIYVVGGGINHCAARFSRRLGRGSASRTPG